MAISQKNLTNINSLKDDDLKSVQPEPELDELVDLLVDVLIGKSPSEATANPPNNLTEDNSPKVEEDVNQQKKSSAFSGSSNEQSQVQIASSELIPEGEKLLNKFVQLIEVSQNEFSKSWEQRGDYQTSVESESESESDNYLDDVEEKQATTEIDKLENFTDPLAALQDLLLGSKLSEFEKVTKDCIDNELPKLQKKIDVAEQKLQAVEDKFDNPDQIFQLLTPGIRNIVNSQMIDSKEDILASIVPIIDEIIAGRKRQNKSGMINAIADLLPGAISQHIINSPEEVAKALAPEIAISIREQRKLDKNAIANALAPEMGRAIKEQIRLERDAMVDALYPVIGNTISKYLTEAIQNINQKVANALSVEGVTRKVRAKIQGVSEAELILQESLPFTIPAIFLIHKNSGLVISEVQSSDDFSLESEMVAGMLTAIRSFVNDCIVQIDDYSELNEIEYGDSKIILEVAGYCYLAVVIKGEPTKEFINKMRKTMSTIVLDYGESIENFEGDRQTVSETVHQLLESLIKSPLEKNSSRFPLALISLGVLMGLLLLIPWGYFSYKNALERRIETATTQTLASTPELAIYDINVEVEGDNLRLIGKVPNQRLKDLAENLVLSTVPELQLDNQIIAVDIPPDPIIISEEVERITALLNGLYGINIETNYSDRKVIISGKVMQIKDAQKISAAFEKVPGVQSVFSSLKIDPVRIENRIYFNEGSAQITPQDITIITNIKEFLEKYPHLSLKIIGHTDLRGNPTINQQLALNRAIAVRDALQNQGIDPKRLQVVGNSQPPTDVASHQPFLLGRTVVFEIIDNQGE